jgi:Rhodopirellula transposase.
MGVQGKVTVEDRRWLKVLGTLNERQARLYVAQKALDLGRGGISRLARLTGMSRPTIMKGIAELSGRGPLPPEEARVRRAGGGRKAIEEADPAVVREISRILDESTAGDPMSSLKWTSRSTRSIAQELKRRGHPVSSVTVGRCLRAMEYSLQANVKTLEGAQHPDRDSQFRHINRQVASWMRSGEPVISVDTKKKELVGRFRNPGQSWKRRGEPDEVFTHDFPDMGEGKAVPYGAYDVGRDEAVVNVGVSHDTSEFAVESIRRWWRILGKKSYPLAERLLICADAGGSNGPKRHAWKWHLQQLANETGLAVTVCHYPPGTSKWNKVEHRLFSFISIQWKGKPLISFATVVSLIGSTTTRTGLKVKAVLDTACGRPRKSVAI